MNRIKLLLALLSLTLFACKSSDQDQEIVKPQNALTLGELEFVVTGDELAQSHFKKGILLLHSFEYEDARVEFLKAQEIDSMFVMAYWGEAMTFNHSLWQRQEREKAIESLEKLAKSSAERISLARTDIEKDFMSAIEILYGEGTKYDRDVKYSDYMKQLKSKYPDHHEVSAFYAISLIGKSRNGRDEKIYEQSALIAKNIIKENPGHPGALHYLIHSYDDPNHAHLAKSAADSYAKVAPDAAHALHMPSHIYLSLGLWNEVITSNIASWNASIKRMDRQELDNDARGYHALNWLQYGFLQRNEIESATTLLKNMVEYTKEKPSTRARSYLLSMKGGHMTETNNFSAEFSDIEIDVEDLDIIDKTRADYLSGMNAILEKDLPRLKEIIDQVGKKINQAELTVGEKGFAMCDAGYVSSMPTQLDISICRVMEMEMIAAQFELLGKNESVTEWYKKASDLESTLSYSFGPPVIFKPAPEAYAEWLLKLENYEGALEMFDLSLERNPRRLLSLEGKKVAAHNLQKQALVANIGNEIEKIKSLKKRSQIL